MGLSVLVLSSAFLPAAKSFGLLVLAVGCCLVAAGCGCRAAVVVVLVLPGALLFVCRLCWCCFRGCCLCCLMSRRAVVGAAFLPWLAVVWSAVVAVSADGVGLRCFSCCGASGALLVVLLWLCAGCSCFGLVTGDFRAVAVVWLWSGCRWRLVLWLLWRLLSAVVLVVLAVGAAAGWRWLVGWCFGAGCLLSLACCAGCRWCWFSFSVFRFRFAGAGCWLSVLFFRLRFIFSFLILFFVCGKYYKGSNKKLAVKK